MQGNTTDADAKSPDAPKTDVAGWQKAFAEKVGNWKKEGCPEILDAGSPEEHFCSAKPHLTKMLPPADGIVTVSVSCQAGHEGHWKHEVPEPEVKAEFERQKQAALAAAADAGKSKDPMKASVTITLDLRTQDVSIEPWVPTPGVGLQLAAMLTAHFQHELMSSRLMKRDDIVTPVKGIINPKTGKPFVS